MKFLAFLLVGLYTLPLFAEEEGTLLKVDCVGIFYSEEDPQRPKVDRVQKKFEFMTYKTCEEYKIIHEFKHSGQRYFLKVCPRIGGIGSELHLGERRNILAYARAVNPENGAMTLYYETPYGEPKFPKMRMYMECEYRAAR